MLSKILRTEPFRIMTLEEAKRQLSIVDFNDDDDHILSLIETATDMVERHKRQFFTTTTVMFEMTPGSNTATLPYPPFKSINTVVNDGYSINHKINPFSGVITLDDPTLNLEESTIVTYDCGHEFIPPIVKHAAKIIVADLYENRESDVDSKTSPVTLNALRLLN